MTTAAPAIRSIPARYRDITFRSTLEARWAHFLDCHRIAWEYEPAGYQLGDVLYEPDFYLPKIRTFLEVKPIIDDGTASKAATLAWALEAKEGDPFENPRASLVIIGAVPIPTAEAMIPGGRDTAAMWHCRRCGEWYFLALGGIWTCRACFAYEGNSHIDGWHDGPCSTCEPAPRFHR